MAPLVRRALLRMVAACLFLLGQAAIAAGEEPSLNAVISGYFGTTSPSGAGRLRAGPGKPRSGEIWLLDLATAQASAVAVDGSYRSPIFLTNGDILALREDVMMRFRRQDQQPIKLRRIRGINKLIGASEAKPNYVLALSGDSTLIEISIEKDEVIELFVNATSKEDAKSLDYLKGWNRRYGSMGLVVRKNDHGKTDVFVHQDQALSNVTNCANVDCGQPSLSFDRQKIAFAKAKK